MRTKLIGTSAIALIMSGAMPVMAQVDPASTSADPRLDRITVTAQRRQQALEDVPISIATFSGEQVEDAGVNDVGLLSLITPGLQVTGSLGSITPYLRGIGTQSGGGGETNSVAIYLDGVYLASPNNGAFAFNNIERIEVLKGPQGTLFGQSATGGLIHIITKDPTQDPSGSVNVSYGNYNTVDGSFYHAQGLTDNLAADIAFTGRYQGDGYGENVVVGGDTNLRREFDIRTKWLWTPLDEARVTFSAYYGENENDLGYNNPFAPGSVGVGPTPALDDIYDVQTNLHAEPDRSSFGGSLKIEYDFGDMQLTSITGYHELEHEVVFDQDGSPLPLNDVIFRTTAESWQQELLLNGSMDKLDWTVGFNFFHDVAAFPPLTLVPAPPPPPAPFPLGPGQRFDIFSEQDLESIAIFAQLTYAITDRTRITAGGRNTWDERSIVGDQQIVDGTLQGPGTPVASFITSSQSVSWSEPTWRFSVDHDVTDELLAFASISRGYKTGAFNLISFANPAADPEILKAYEGGLKFASANGNFRANASAYFYQYENMQLLRSVVGGAELLNAAESEIIGVDFDMTWAATDQLQFSTSVAWMDGEFTDYPDADILDVPNTVIGGFVPMTGDVSGNTTLQSPEWTFNLLADYTIPLETGSIDFNMSYTHTSEVFYSVDNSLSQEPFNVINANAGYFASGGWGVKLWVKNLTNEEYLAIGSLSSAGAYTYFHPPRTYGVELSYSWGE
ncbi:MAG: TonB-dependent receptor [Pseudomonadota bacterium]